MDRDIKLGLVEMVQRSIGQVKRHCTLLVACRVIS
jgi:hypothetical protein